MEHCSLYHTCPQMKFFSPPDDLSNHLSQEKWGCWVFPLGQKLFLFLPGLWTLWSFPGLPNIQLVLERDTGDTQFLGFIFMVFKWLVVTEIRDAFSAWLWLPALGTNLTPWGHLQMTWCVTLPPLISAEHEFPLRLKPKKTSQTSWAILLS